MNRNYLLIGLLLGLSGLACQKKHEPNKIVNSLPTDVGTTVTPAEATQQFLLVNKDAYSLVVNIINRLNYYATPSFPELTDIGGGYHRFTMSNSKYGSATADIAFYNAGSIINPSPVVVHTSTNVISSVSVDISGTSQQFNFTQNSDLTLVTPGDLLSNRIVTGDANFNGSAHALTFTILSGGLIATTEGISQGRVGVAGTGNGGQPVTMQFGIDIDHNTNGQISWNDEEGQIHFDSKVQGIVVTGDRRLIVP